MAITSPNYTQIPNEFLDKWIPKLNGAAIKVFLVIARQEFGWHREKIKLSEKLLMDLSGIMSKETLHNAVSELLSNDLIKKEVVGESFSAETFYNISVDTGTEIVPHTRTENVPLPGTEIVHIERKSIKKDENNAGTAKAKVKRSNKGLTSNPLIVLDLEAGQYENVTDDDFKFWKTLHPTLDIDMELGKSIGWVRSHPDRAKANYRAFISNWLNNAEKHVYGRVV